MGHLELADFADLNTDVSNGFAARGSAARGCLCVWLLSLSKYSTAAGFADYAHIKQYEHSLIYSLVSMQ